MCSSCWKASAKFAPSSVVASTTPFAAIHDSASFSKSATGFREAESGLGFFAVDAQYALKGDRCLAKSVDFCKLVVRINFDGVPLAVHAARNSLGQRPSGVLDNG